MTKFLVIIHPDNRYALESDLYWVTGVGQSVVELPPGAKMLTREEVGGVIESATSAISPDVINGILDELFGRGWDA